MELRDAALKKRPLSYEAVNGWYTDKNPMHAVAGKIVLLCESHERLRAELSGAEVMLQDDEKTISQLRKENERQRDALQAIVAEFVPGERKTYGDVTATIDRIRQIAQAAIQKESQP